MTDRSRAKSELSKILDESGDPGHIISPNALSDEEALDDEGGIECTGNTFRITDPEAKHRLKMIISGEEPVSQVRNIVNWPSSLSYRLKSLLGLIVSPSFMLQCLRLPKFAFYSLEALIFIGIVLLPVMVLETVFYPIFRLLFGVLYPAYASYKAVRTRDVKKYVSKLIDGQ